MWYYDNQSNELSFTLFTLQLVGLLQQGLQGLVSFADHALRLGIRQNLQRLFQCQPRVRGDLTLLHFQLLRMLQLHLSFQQTKRKEGERGKGQDKVRGTSSQVIPPI